jgi:hypothetical protein
MIWKRIQMIITTPWNNPVIKKKKKEELKILMNPRLKLRSKDQKQTIVFSVSFP